MLCVDSFETSNSVLYIQFYLASHIHFDSQHIRLHSAARFGRKDWTTLKIFLFCIKIILILLKCFYWIEITNLLSVVFFLQYVSTIIPASSFGIPKISTFNDIFYNIWIDLINLQIVFQLFIWQQSPSCACYRQLATYLC